MSICINEGIILDEFIGLKVYARCRIAAQNGRGTRVFYGTLLKHRVLNLYRLTEGERMAGWFDRDDILEVSDKPNI